MCILINFVDDALNFGNSRVDLQKEHQGSQDTSLSYPFSAGISLGQWPCMPLLF